MPPLRDSNQNAKPRPRPLARAESFGKGDSPNPLYNGLDNRPPPTGRVRQMPRGHRRTLAPNPTTPTPSARAGSSKSVVLNAPRKSIFVLSPRAQKWSGLWNNMSGQTLGRPLSAFKLSGSSSGMDPVAVGAHATSLPTVDSAGDDLGTSVSSTLKLSSTITYNSGGMPELHTGDTSPAKQYLAHESFSDNSESEAPTQTQIQGSIESEDMDPSFEESQAAQDLAYPPTQNQGFYISSSETVTDLSSPGVVVNLKLDSDLFRFDTPPRQACAIDSAPGSQTQLNVTSTPVRGVGTTIDHLSSPFTLETTELSVIPPSASQVTSPRSNQGALGDRSNENNGDLVALPYPFPWFDEDKAQNPGRERSQNDALATFRFSPQKFDSYYRGRAKIHEFNPEEPRPSNLSLIFDAFGRYGITLSRFGQIMVRCEACQRVCYVDCQDKHCCTAKRVKRSRENGRWYIPSHRALDLLTDTEKSAGLTQKELEEVFVICHGCERVLAEDRSTGHVCNPDVAADT
ncbi:hypothetical protein EST38_g2531 [Candolleomyces aberdarensis]|uniref:Uncharacterized protein n=1 Tax=Candolleomyces aberdarensis TaxID=2316362 RepID=A0A4Q2DUA5_9AGAR|nr:hypothetical protein EST38_g2531 [Candolleomyces aberdarensis]